MPAATHVDYKIVSWIKSGGKTTATIRIYRGFYGDALVPGVRPSDAWIVAHNVYQRTAMVREVTRRIDREIDFDELRADLKSILALYKGTLTPIPEQA